MNADVQSLRSNLSKAVTQVEKVLLGKPHTIRMAFACLLAGGHLLLDDLPGMGKTTLARTLAKTLGMSFHRIQFTSDLLPAEILGVSIFDSHQQKFSFHPGPIFTQALLADEINRASPRTQSALLEAMAEGQVSMDGETHYLPTPFFVIATQNPVDLSGTFPLPDSQMDRFLVRLELGYPDEANERLLLQQDGAIEPDNDHIACLEPEQVLALQEAARQIKANEYIISYVQRILSATRKHPSIRTGLSPRGGLALLRMAKSWAMLDNRDYVTPEDVQKVFHEVSAHRIVWRVHSEQTALNILLKEILEGVHIS